MTILLYKDKIKNRLIQLVGGKKSPSLAGISWEIITCMFPGRCWSVSDNSCRITAGLYYSFNRL